MRSLSLQLVLLGVWLNVSVGQTVVEVRKAALEAAARISNLSSVSIKASINVDEEIVRSIGIVNVQQQGEMKRLSFDPSVVKSEDQPAEYYDRMRKASGSTLPVIYSFDGKYAFNYMPFRQTLLKEPAIEFGGTRWQGSLFPSGWISISGLPTANVTLLLSGNSTTEVEPPKDPQSPWLFFREFENDNYAFKRIEFVVDPKFGFHVTEFKTTGGALGDSTARFDWAQNDGQWYPKSAVIEDYRGIKIKWVMLKIDFEDAAITEPFTIPEELLPVGTKIHSRSRVRDANGRPLTEDIFVGGADGLAEHRLRQQAINKVREEFR
jgi:hypothetical protein